MSLIGRIAFWLKCREFCIPRRLFKTALGRRAMEKRTGYFVSLCNSACEYIDETFLDRPAIAGESGQDFYSESVSICAALAREYGGGDPLRYMDTPLKVGFQFLNEIREMWAAKAGKKAGLFTPSDSIRRDFLNQLNGEQKN
jgi:hypothetical protein